MHRYAYIYVYVYMYTHLAHNGCVNTVVSSHGVMSMQLMLFKA